VLFDAVGLVPGEVPAGLQRRDDGVGVGAHENVDRASLAERFGRAEIRPDAAVVALEAEQLSLVGSGFRGSLNRRRREDDEYPAEDERQRQHRHGDNGSPSH
jgi:hypothetical protein